MRLTNTEIAEFFTRLANLLDIQGENPFRIRAYRNAARVIANYPKSFVDAIDEGEDLTAIPGIGNHIADDIRIIIKSNALPKLKDIEKTVPPVLNDLLKIQGLGPKRVKLLYSKLHIKSMADLKKAIQSGKVQSLKGFGEKLCREIMTGIDFVGDYAKRFKWNEAEQVVRSLLAYFKKCKAITRVECAGSFRRCKETVGDLDFLAISNKGPEVIDYFIHYPDVTDVLSKGTTRSTLRLRSGMQVDLRVLPKESYGAALLYFTGSKDHNIVLRQMAQKKKLKINEYGVFKDNDQRVAGKTEEEIYRLLGMDYVEPEMREARGEIELALKGKLPRLITLDEIRGDLHCHTDATDGDDTLEAMAKAAEALGYAYLAITDHTQRLTVAHGLDKKRLLQQIKRIDVINKKLKKLVLLKSSEVDILEDGSLDLPNEILKELDLTVCSVHSYFHLSEKKQTERILRAMDNPYFSILGHPSGRLLQHRDAYQIDFERIVLGVKERQCFLELNGQPDRLDITDVQCLFAKEVGVKIAISSDAHSVSQLSNMRLGVGQARRGWLSPSDVINSASLPDLKKLLKR